ncbi:alpha/beta hydrolase family protein [Angustibacter luteus]|uniref:Alpha/beta hydrolase family protein n=1 Tax=Angustibacter luteus TaxID=658456 RepID=A0ABW1JGA8_9ACTN
MSRPTRPTRRQVLGGALASALLAGCGGRDDGRAAVPDARRHTYRYGADDVQVADLLLPTTPASRVAVLVHGGYWQAEYRKSLEDQVAADLVSRGWAVWNIDYRGIGGGGGWPTTFTDVASATDLLATAAAEHHLPTDGVLAVGHSAGGPLALWLAARSNLGARAPGGRPKVRVVGAVSQAGVNDLAAGSEAGLGGGAVDDLMGGTPVEQPARYAVADPRLLVPLRVPLLVVTGGADDVVPLEQSTGFAAAARADGDDVQLSVVPGEDHGAHLDPTSTCWRTTRDWLEAQRR